MEFELTQLEIVTIILIIVITNTIKQFIKYKIFYAYIPFFASIIISFFLVFVKLLEFKDIIFFIFKTTAGGFFFYEIILDKIKKLIKK